MAQSPKPLPLLTGEPPPPPRNLGLQQSRSNQLWIAIHLPALALEALSRPCSRDAVVVVEPRGGHQRVIAADKRALTQGIKPDLRLSAAFGLSDALSVQERSPEDELVRLESLAKWTRRFTPCVSLEPPQAVLMEVSGSLKLFGGLEVIKAALEQEFRRRQLTAHLCSAPTALAALWLARQESEDVRFPGELVGRLSVLPLRVTGWPDKTQRLLESLGVGTIRDCLRLPRDGFVRRIGERYLRDLDRSLGWHDPRLEFVPSQRLSSVHEFPDEVVDPVILSAAGEKLVERLVGALRKYQARIQNFELSFYHLHCSVTVKRVILADPTHERSRLLMLFRDRLERVSLPAPVIALGLRTGRIESAVGRNATLFRDRTQQRQKAAMGELMERLRGRFGTGVIYAVDLVEEHRPEGAWIRSTTLLLRRSASAPWMAPCAQQRPLWILPAPLLLESVAGDLPHYRSQVPLRLESGPERIEAGWWDGEDISRDYYVASGSKGEKLWIYQDRMGPRWYLHGIFG